MTSREMICPATDDTCYFMGYCAVVLLHLDPPAREREAHLSTIAADLPLDALRNLNNEYCAERKIATLIEIADSPNASLQLQVGALRIAQNIRRRRRQF